MDSSKTSASALASRPISRFQSLTIRMVDLCGAIILLAIACLPLLVIAAAIRFADGGPALFRQQRVGQGCEPFTIYKFRTMRHRRLDNASRDDVSTKTGDSRITRIGKVLRPSHLDELPQILNVLKGDMSFVGVRPDTPVQERDYSAEHWQQRHLLRPGITGPSQLIRGDVTLPMRIAAEREWIADASIAKYLAVLFSTVGKVFSRSSH